MYIFLQILQNLQNEPDHQILHIRISLGTKFQPNSTKTGIRDLKQQNWIPPLTFSYSNYTWYKLSS